MKKSEMVINQNVRLIDSMPKPVINTNFDLLNFREHSRVALNQAYNRNLVNLLETNSLTNKKPIHVRS